MITTQYLQRIACVLWWDGCYQLLKHLPLSLVDLKPFHKGNYHSFHFTDEEVEAQMNSSFPEETPLDKSPGALALKLHTVSLSDIQRQDFSFWVEICPTQIQTDSAQVQRESKGSVRGKNIPFLALDQSGMPSWPCKCDSPHCANSIRRVYFHRTCWVCPGQYANVLVWSNRYLGGSDQEKILSLTLNFLVYFPTLNKAISL